MAVAARSAPSAGAKRAAVLLRGLWNYPGIMTRLAGTLQAKGRAVANVGYSSGRLSLAAHGAVASRAARALAEDGAREVSFGGFSSRVRRWPIRNGMVGAPVVLSSSVRPSAAPQLPSNSSMCPDTEQLLAAVVTPSRRPVPRQSRSQFARMVIAGGTGGVGYNPLIPGDNDGLIAVEETRMQDRETAFLLLRSPHNHLRRGRRQSWLAANFSIRTCESSLTSSLSSPLADKHSRLIFNDPAPKSVAKGSDDLMSLDSSIPSRLRCPRTRTRRASDNWKSAVPADSSIGPQSIKQLVMAYFGVQSKGGALALPFRLSCKASS
jgi:hypothetical protein